MANHLSLLWISFFSSLTIGDPQGHLLPLGSQRDSEGQIEEISGWTAPRQFYSQFVDISRPVVFRGALNDSSAVRLWNDAYLRNQYGSHSVKVDISKKENRLLDSFQVPLSTFLDHYNTSNWYLVDTISPQMGKDIQLPECLKCGGYTQTIQDIVMWFSSGNTKSSFHFDTVENLHCQISGVKHWFFVDKEESGLHEAIDHMESDFSGVDVDAVDLYHYPKFQDVPWWSAESHLGDCVYVPYKWFHYVNSVGRNVAVNIWWTPFDSFNHTDCEANEESKQTTLADLTFRPGAQIRFLIIEMIKLNNNEITFKTANSLLVREHDGTQLMSKQTFNMLDANNDGLLIEGEISQIDTDFFEKNIDCKPGEINIHGQSQVDKRCQDGQDCFDNNENLDKEQTLWDTNAGTHTDL